MFNKIKDYWEKAAWQKIVITCAFIFGILLANVGTKYFFASIVTSEFGNKSNTGALGYEVAIPTYEGYNTESGSINIFAGETLTNINAIGFKIKYSPSEIIFKQNIDPIGFNPDMIDINVDNINGILEINIINADAFTINKNSEFVKIEGIINENLIIGDQIRLEVSNIEIINSKLQISQGKGRDGIINIIDSPVLIENLLIPENAIELNATGAVITFNDYLKQIGSITITGQTISNIIRNGKTVSFEHTALNPGEIYEINLSGFIGNTTNGLKESSTYIAGYKTSGTKISFDKQITKNTIEVEFDTSTLIKDEIENPVNYKFYKGDNTSSLLKINSITLTSAKALITFANTLEANSRYILIADGISNMSNNKIISFIANSIGDVSIYSITPNSCNITGCNITISGDNLKNVAKILIGTKVVTVNTGDSKTININTGNLNSGIYDITLEDINGKKISLKNSLTITEDSFEQITILSSESYAAPSKILNNNEMTTTLWVAVEGSLGVNAINSVVVDLRPLGYGATTIMNKSAIVNNKVWYKLENVKAFHTTHASGTGINLTVTAEDTNGLKSVGTITLEVSNNLISSEAPEILDVSVVYSKEKREIEIYAKVSDKDGINDVETISVDLTSLGLGYQILHAIDSTSQNVDQSSSNTENDLGGNIFDARNEKTTSIFGLSSPLKIPSDKTTGKYNILINAYDRTGEEGSFNQVFDFKGGTHPEFVQKYHSTNKNDPLNDFIHLSRYSIPRDGETSFDMSVIIKDEDGISDIVEVRADITNLGGTVAIFERQGEQRGVDYSAVKTGIFSAQNITIPKHIIPGWREFQIIATDKQGNETIIRAEVKITDGDELNKGSEILAEKSYTKPAILVNDGETKFSIYTFIKNNGNEIDSVIINLGNIAKFSGAFESGESSYCKNQTENILCLKPSIIEGTDGQWFNLNDVIILKSTKPSTERYKIETIIVEKGGRKIAGNTYLTVGDGGLPDRSYASTKLQMAISTDTDEIQLVFTNPLENREIKTSMFKITNVNDTSDMLAIKEIKINSDSNIISLTTAQQKPGKKYTVIADTKKLLLQEDSFTDNHKNFYGFDKDDLPPQLLGIEAESKTKIALNFDQGLLPSSIGNTADHFEIFTRENESKKLRVLSHEFSSSNNKILYLSTKPQTRNQDYIIRVKNVLSAAGVPVGGYKRKFSTYAKSKYFGITKQFTGFSMLAAAEERNKSAFELSNPTKGKCIDFVDFTMFSQDYKKGVPSSEYFDYDYNNKIDFKDFTMFSSQYGKCDEKEAAADEVEILDVENSQESLCTNAVIGRQDIKNPLCEAFFIGYQYDNKSNTCIEKGVTGCTFETPFKNLEECQNSCIKLTTESGSIEENTHSSADQEQDFGEEIEKEMPDFGEEIETEETFNQVNTNNQDNNPDNISNLFQ